MLSSSKVSFISESFTCEGTSAGELTLESVEEDAGEKLTAWAGYQFVRKVQCPNTWQYKAEKQVNVKICPWLSFSSVISGFFSFIATERNAPELY